MEDRKYYRFRVMALIFLAISSTQASNGPKRCAEVVSALMTTDHITIVQDSKFIGNVVDCIDQIKQAGNEGNKLQPVIQKLPELIEKALPVAKEAGMVLLSVYVLYRSFELYDRAMNLEKDYIMYHERFETLKDEMEPLRDLKVTQLISQWKEGNADNLEKYTDMLLERVSRQLTRCRELFHAILRETKIAESDNRWSAAYNVVGVAVCVGSIAVGNVPVVFVTCGLGTGTVVFSTARYITNRHTLTKLDLFIEDALSMREELRKYRSQLDHAKIKAIKCTGIDPQKRTDCGFPGITRKECEDIRGCCFDRKNPKVPNCFFVTPVDSCSVRPESRNDCGWHGIDEKTCKRRGCCYDDTAFGFNTKICFYPTVLAAVDPPKIHQNTIPKECYM